MKAIKPGFWEKVRKWFVNVALLAILGYIWKGTEPILLRLIRIDETGQRVEKILKDHLKEDSLNIIIQTRINSTFAQEIVSQRDYQNSMERRYSALESMAISMQNRLNNKTFIHNE